MLYLWDLIFTVFRNSGFSPNVPNYIIMVVLMWINDILSTVLTIYYYPYLILICLNTTQIHLYAVGLWLLTFAARHWPGKGVQSVSENKTIGYLSGLCYIIVDYDIAWIYIENNILYIIYVLCILLRILTIGNLYSIFTWLHYTIYCFYMSE